MFKRRFPSLIDTLIIAHSLRFVKPFFLFFSDFFGLAAWGFSLTLCAFIIAHSQGFVKGFRNINLAKARELMPGVVTDEASMVEHAGELIALAGVTLRPYVEVQKKFHELLAEYKPKYEVKGTKDVPYVAKTNSGNGGEGGDNQGDQGGDNGGGNSDLEG